MGNVGIYKITSPSNRVYIGQSWNIKRRFWDYKGIDCKKQPKLYNSLLKYGVKSHEFKIIHELPPDVTQEIMDIYEDVYMSQYKDCGFDLLNTKGAGSKGKHSEETKLKISIKHKGKGLGIKHGPWSAEQRYNMSIAQKGRKKNPDHVEKVRLAMIGKKASEETKKKMSLSRIGRKPTEESIEKMKKTKKERGITMSPEVIKKGIPTRFKKGAIPSNKGKNGLQISWNKGKTGIYNEETISKIKAARALQKPTFAGRSHSEESRLKMSESAKKRGNNLPIGFKHSEETKKKLSIINTGRPSPNKGKVTSDSTRAKQRRAKLGRTGNLCPNSKKIVCSLTGTIYASIVEAANSIGIKRSTLQSYLLGVSRNKTTLNYHTNGS